MTASSRGGVSLLEVLISIGVVTIGLLGVIALIPVANLQVTRGLIEDNKSTAGKNWVAEFSTKGMGRVKNWLEIDASNNASSFTFDPDDPQAFVIDPRFVARHGGDIDPVAPATVERDAKRFPYIVASPPPIPPAVALPPFTAISMPRITLRRHLDGTGGRMSQIMADELFVARDDLLYSRNEDEEFPPVQQLASHDTADLKRQSDGTLSWMATLVPKQRGTGVASDLYTLSIIVFQGRDSEMRMNAASDDEDNERLAHVKLAGDFYSGGVGGGDMKITALGTGTEWDVDVRTGDWVMLAGQYDDPVGAGSVTVRAFKWYRVIGNDPFKVKDATDVPIRFITLHGPDWDAVNMPTPQVTIMPGVVAVYEKTIRLETTSMWAN